MVIEDGMGYMEPPRLYQPVRHCLGRMLLSDGRLAEAAQVRAQPLCFVLKIFCNFDEGQISKFSLPQRLTHYSSVEEPEPRSTTPCDIDELRFAAQRCCKVQPVPAPP